MKQSLVNAQDIFNESIIRLKGLNKNNECEQNVSISLSVVYGILLEIENKVLNECLGANIEKVEIVNNWRNI